MKFASLALLVFGLCLQGTAIAQSDVPGMRLPRTLLDVRAPSERVEGQPGNMRIVDRGCQAFPRDEVRRRIVNTAIQEWAFFGYSTDKQPRTPAPPTETRRPFSYARLSESESERLASSIAGYWAATPDSDWILQRQNAAWRDEGIGQRWQDAWSAAFISWVMCESGLADPAHFKRAIAHHTYIDQAILATEGDADSAFEAHTPGTQPIVPGDMLCRGSRPAYRTIAQRRSQLGVGARTHCDIVVNVDEQAQQIAVVGGNVRATVRMKLLPAKTEGLEAMAPLSDNGRPLFAHLKLRAAPIENDALAHAPSLADAGCQIALGETRLPSMPIKPTTDC